MSHELPDDIAQLLDGLSIEQLRKLKSDLLKPEGKGKPVIMLEIEVEHDYNCLLCGRIWKKIQRVKANTRDIPDSLTIRVNTCFQCEFNLLKHWDKQTLVIFLVAVAEHGIEKAYQEFPAFKGISQEAYELIMLQSGFTPREVNSD